MTDAERAESMSERIYRIKARDVVPGMKRRGAIPNDGGRWNWVWMTVDAVERDGRLVRMRTRYGARTFQPFDDEDVEVQLPGPSPRELICTCLRTLVLDDSDGARSASDAIARWKSRAPQKHDAACPVAPNTDRAQGPIHGGVRLWPVPTRFSAWECIGTLWMSGYDQCPHGHRCEEADDDRHWMCPWVGVELAEWLCGDDTGINEPHYGDEEIVLQSFFLPPVIPEPEPMRTPWEPYDPMELL